jgi:hypothetical protein
LDRLIHPGRNKIAGLFSIQLSKFKFQPILITGLLILCLSFSVSKCKAGIIEQFIQDTLTVELSGPDPPQPLSIRIAEIKDNRNVPDVVLKISEKNRWAFVPVDLLIQSHPPVQDFLKQYCIMNSPSKEASLRISLLTLRLEESSGSLVYPHYQLNSTVQIERCTSDSTGVPAGYFYHECYLRKPLFSNKIEKGFAAIITQWRETLFKDLDSQFGNSGRLSGCGCFSETSISEKTLQLMIQGTYGYGFRDRVADIQIEVSPVSVRNWTFREGGLFLRYRHGDAFESIEYALINERISHFLTPNYRLLFTGMGLIGFNRWHDTESVKHKWYDAVILELSGRQQIVWKQKSLVLGVGFFESFNYIYSRDYCLDGGVMVSVGFQL